MIGTSDVPGRMSAWPATMAFTRSLLLGHEYGQARDDLQVSDPNFRAILMTSLAGCEEAGEGDRRYADYQKQNRRQTFGPHGSPSRTILASRQIANRPERIRGGAKPLCAGCATTGLVIRCA